MRLKVGIVGCGTIGTILAKECAGRLKNKVVLAGLCDSDRKKIDELNKKINKRLPALTLDAVILKSDLVIESASLSVSPIVARKCIKHKKDCLIMSAGGLIGKKRLFESAEKRAVKIYVPSGALCGIDGVKSASVGKITRAILTTRKPPKGLQGAPYLVKNKIKLESIKSDTVVFKGNALDAIKGFPKNVNVSSILSLAGIGPKKTEVIIIASPGGEKNIHELTVEGEFGRLFTKVENVPSADNPKTSQLAAFSAIAVLKQIVTAARIGT